MSLIESADWDFKLLDKMLSTCEEYGTKLGYDFYPNRVEIVSSEQMLDAYASIGMPVFYNHWSFGKQLLRDTKAYQANRMGLAYELVINSIPCVAYCMEDNTALMQLLVMAHACVSADTEYLSPYGWQRMDSYVDDFVGQYNIDGTVTFVKPTDYIVRPQEKFLQIKGEAIDQVVTEDHSLVVKEKDVIKIKPESLKFGNNNNKWKVISKFKLKSNSRMILNYEEIRFNLWLKLFGNTIHSHANVHTIELKVKNSQVAAFAESLEHTTASISMCVKKKNYTIYHIEYHQGTNFDSRWYNASSKQLSFIYKYLMELSGNKFEAKHIDYAQFVATASGHTANIVKKSKKFSLDVSGKNAKLGKYKITEIDAKDRKAYCFSVPSTMFVIRHNGKIAVTGNCIGHNDFFKNNYLFKEWTDPQGLLDYLEYSKNFVRSCEEKYGQAEVEKTLDAVHALMPHGIFKHPKKRPRSLQEEEERAQERFLEWEKTYNILWSTIPSKTANTRTGPSKKVDSVALIRLPEENVLYFLEKYSPKLKPWQREIVRIGYNTAQYFYPQMQDKTLNEGWATTCHYTILNMMYDDGLLSDGNMLEFIKSHSGVVAQPKYNSPYFSGINPYYLGFEMFADVKRICENPTAEDKEWFPDFAGCKNYWPVWFDMRENYRDESGILQFLSPTLIRKMKLFSVHDKSTDSFQTVTHIQNEDSYKELRKLLAESHDRDHHYPNINIVGVNLEEDRILHLEYTCKNNQRLEEVEAKATLNHLSYLWGYKVELDYKTVE